MRPLIPKLHFEYNGEKWRDMANITLDFAQSAVAEHITIPVVPGGQTNLYSKLTTFYVPPTAGWVLAAVVVALMSFAAWRGYQRKKLVGASVDGEMVFPADHQRRSGRR